MLLHETENAVMDNHSNHQLDKGKKKKEVSCGRTSKATCVWSDGK